MSKWTMCTDAFCYCCSSLRFMWDKSSNASHLQLCLHHHVWPIFYTPLPVQAFFSSPIIRNPTVILIWRWMYTPSVTWSRIVGNSQEGVDTKPQRGVLICGGFDMQPIGGLWCLHTHLVKFGFPDLHSVIWLVELSGLGQKCKTRNKSGSSQCGTRTATLSNIFRVGIFTPGHRFLVFPAVPKSKLCHLS